MMFKNAFRLFCANFDKVWKYLVYQILCWGIVFGLLAVFYGTISSSIIAACGGLGEYFSTGTFYGVSVLDACSQIVGAIVKFFKLLFDTNIFCGLYVVFVLVIVKPILTNIGKYAICEMMYKYMSSLSKTTFTGCLLGTLKKSIPYALLKTLYVIPFDALILASIYGITRVNADWYVYVFPFVCVILPSLLLAFRLTFVAGWAPARIVLDNNIAKSYRQGMSAILRRGAKVFSTAFVLFVMIMLLIMVLGFYSLIIIVPCLVPLLSIFEMTAFFSSQGMRFYVDSETILSPKKLEEVDKIDKAKYLL